MYQKIQGNSSVRQRGPVNCSTEARIENGRLDFPDDFHLLLSFITMLVLEARVIQEELKSYMRVGLGGYLGLTQWDSATVCSFSILYEL